LDLVGTFFGGRGASLFYKKKKIRNIFTLPFLPKEYSTKTVPKSA